MNDFDRYRELSARPMKITHELKATGVCPVDNSADVYTIRVRTRLLIKVEDIRAAVEDLLSAPTYQEAFTRALRERLPFAEEVETVCFHQGAGVETTAVLR